MASTLSSSRERSWFSVPKVLPIVISPIKSLNYYETPDGPVFGSGYSFPSISVPTPIPSRTFLWSWDRGRATGEAHPSSALLIVEVSDTTLIYDRGRKASLYAMRGVADYWIVNVNDDQLEIHRDPGADRTQPFGYGYASLTVHHRGDVVTPQAAPHLSFSVADLLG